MKVGLCTVNNTGPGMERLLYLVLSSCSQGRQSVAVSFTLFLLSSIRHFLSVQFLDFYLLIITESIKSCYVGFLRSVCKRHVCILFLCPTGSVTCIYALVLAKWVILF